MHPNKFNKNVKKHMGYDERPRSQFKVASVG